MPELQVLNGSLQWKTVPIGGARFLIGRKDSCHLILKDGWVSREHTLIMEPKPGEFRVQDLDSENGTYLNGERIRDTAMRHGDVLRVGRTEMRFIQHGQTSSDEPADDPGATGKEAPLGSALPGLRTESFDPPDLDHAAAQARRGDPMSRTSVESSAKRDTPRIDLRERVRRLEEILLEGEQANASLAAENAVLKRALARLGLLDKKTGSVDPSRLTPPPMRLVPDALLPFVTNPLARITFPGTGPEGGDRPGPGAGNSNPALFRLGLAGIDSLGIRFVESLARLGYRSAVAVTAERDSMRGGVVDPAWRVFLDRPRAGRPAGSSSASAFDNVFTAAMPRIEDVFHEAFADCDRVLLCADAGSQLCAEGIGLLGDVVRRSGAQPGAVLFFDPTDDEADARARAEAAFAAARVLAEAGRIAPVFIFDLSRFAAIGPPGESGDATATALDSLAGTLDALIRLPALPCSGPKLEPAAVGAQIVSRGWATIGLAATRSTGRADVEAAFAHALGPGLMATAMPPSRARSAFVCTVAGRESDLDPQALEAARATLARLLPQAQRLDAMWHDAGKALRVITFVGGLPFPETFFSHGHP